MGGGSRGGCREGGLTLGRKAWNRISATPGISQSWPPPPPPSGAHPTFLSQRKWGRGLRGSPGLEDHLFKLCTTLKPYCVHPPCNLPVEAAGVEGVVWVCVWTRLLPSLWGFAPPARLRAGNRHHLWLIIFQVSAALDTEPGVPGVDPDTHQYLLAMRASLGHEKGELLDFLRAKDWTCSKRRGS